MTIIDLLTGIIFVLLVCLTPIIVLGAVIVTRDMIGFLRSKR